MSPICIPLTELLTNGLPPKSCRLAKKNNMQLMMTENIRLRLTPPIRRINPSSLTRTHIRKAGAASDAGFTVCAQDIAGAAAIIIFFACTTFRRANCIAAAIKNWPAVKSE